MIYEGGLGRREPKDFSHVRRMPMSATMATEPPRVVEKELILPSWHQKHDQGQEGACVGFGTSMMLSILNEHQVRRQGQKDPYIRYNPWWLWNQAKLIDTFSDTNPGDSNGSTVKAACEILVSKGHVLWEPEDSVDGYLEEPNSDFGIQAVRWATTIDEMRSAIDSNNPLSIGINWYKSFGNPEYIDTEYWIGRGEFGVVSGGHCICIFRASDRRQAFKLKNSWGSNFPEVWLPYASMDRLIREGGEVALISDR